MPDLHERLLAARLYLVCDAPSERLLDAALDGGVGVVQLRMKAASDGEIVAAGRRVAVACAAGGALFILNDRPDLVVAVGADGVHVGQDDSPVAEARRTVGSDRIVGLSTHSPAQIDAAREADVDYIGVGPVHATPTKPGRPGTGLELVRYAAEHAAVPFFAIGGINLDTIAAVTAAGAQRVAVVRALSEARDPRWVARGLMRALGREVGVGTT